MLGAAVIMRVPRPQAGACFATGSTVDHLTSEGEEWLYYYCQREAIETLIYLYEVVKTRRLYDLASHFDDNQRVRVNPADDRWARYVFKMATGSGKTKVMSLAHCLVILQCTFRTTT